MLAAVLLPQTVTIVRYEAGADNEYGNPELVAADPIIVKARLEQLTTRETTIGQDTVLDRWRAFLPAGTSIVAGDELLEGGRRFRVEGTPEVVYGASSPHHLEVLLTYAADVTFAEVGASSSNYDTALYDLAVYA